MMAAVLEKAEHLVIREIDIKEYLSPHDVRIKITNVGICGSDMHYFKHGKIGPFIVKEPMVLGHEGSGIITETGSEVKTLKVGDCVCMEPGIPDNNSVASKRGIYNLDPDVKFWATPPVHGILRTSVIHPAEYTYKLPEAVSLEEGALVEPLAIGVHAATKACIKPGDIALVIGAGTIGIVTAFSALAGGCSNVIISDIRSEKLDIFKSNREIITINSSKENLHELVMDLSGGWGADIVFETSGNKKITETILDDICPSGKLVYIGMPADPVYFDIVKAQSREISIITIFRYAHVFPKAIALIGSGKIDVNRLITSRFAFKDCAEAFTNQLNPKAQSIKTMIQLTE
ncbi:MAG: sulfurtransferase [Spirochaetes bacterium GWF1_41_5]|nr:MAG: sulfurtransferase [Spirochaetes bacterium GWF1_41_5]HBE01639.1 NAD(P)-dependent alcohol dehydrogenase [Spirochaetia bacterium]